MRDMAKQPLVETVEVEVQFNHREWPGADKSWQWFLELVNRLPGVTVLNTCRHDFPGGGLSGVVVIGESHAAIHTWPEHGIVWCQLSTCGDRTALEIFEREVQAL